MEGQGEQGPVGRVKVITDICKETMLSVGRKIPVFRLCVQHLLRLYM